MKTQYNTRLSQNAKSSALSCTGAILFLCDSKLHVCMKAPARSEHSSARLWEPTSRRIWI